VADQGDAFGHWLAGFIDGEGSFSVRRAFLADGRTVANYSPRFELGLRADDGPILEKIRGTLAIGAVYGHVTGRSGCHVRRWYVGSKADCMVLVDFLDRYPLRSKKAADYVLWREAVQLWQGTGGRWGNFDWTRIAEIRDLLMAGRSYVAAAA
jgi:hypothetical protein